MELLYPKWTQLKWILSYVCLMWSVDVWQWTEWAEIGTLRLLLLLLVLVLLVQ